MSKAKSSTISKKTKSVEPIEAKASNQSIEKLSAIRDLLFGEQVSELEKSSKEQHQALNKRLDNLEDLIAKSSAEFSKQLTGISKKFTDDLENNRLEHVSQESILEDKFSSIESQLSDYQQQSDKEFSQSHQSMLNMAKELEQSLADEVKRLNKKIEVASSELSANKADRKTLASLLESMASNLTESQA